MIVTLTANPSLDRTISLTAPLAPGVVQNAAGMREDAGGKGINVARVVHHAGITATAVLPLATDDPFRAPLHATGIALHTVDIAGHARANLTITDPTGETTKINLPGANLEASDADAVIDAVVTASEGARWLVLAGSLPPGVAADFYVDVAEAVRERWGSAAPQIAVDTSGAALTAVVAAGVADLIKPNDDELADLAGVLLDDEIDLPQAVLTVARTLVPSKTRAALITLGSAGAVLVNAEGAWAALPPKITVLSTVGAGDSSLAGYLIADERGESASARLATAIRYGAAAATLAGTQAPTESDLPSGDIIVTPLT